MALVRIGMCAALLMATLQSGVAYAQPATLVVERQSNIPYVSGGIGKEESDALQSVQGEYNLQIMNADKTGHFTGDTRITIRDARAALLLDTIGGPIFYANLPKGRYIVEGFAADKSNKQNVTITSGKTARIHFTWPDDTLSDGTAYQEGM